MPTAIFDHEKLKAYQQALRFVAWVDPLLARLPGKLAVKDQLDRASTSVVLNLAEGNGKRSGLDRCRFFDISRGSAVECAACLDVFPVKKLLRAAESAEGKASLIEIVPMTAGLITRFSTPTHEEQAEYAMNTGVEEKDKE